ncbi:methyltransferase domain-containing protein [Polymorphobacter sp.]|uniref:class I SAM-dependent methyltransferase n=1 Tax=Polymorphobacter sp. TaxID=1909290 RepID=UPI003F6FEA5B
MTSVTHDPGMQLEHGILAIPSSEEESRQMFVKSLKFHLATKVAPGNKLAYEQRALPAFIRQRGAAPTSRHEIRQMMGDDPYFSLWGAMQRTSQEMMWNSVQVSVERQNADIQARGNAGTAPLGSLRTDPSMPIPNYISAVDIHCMPGNYHGEYQADDLANGAVYDRAVWLYAMGRMGPLNDDMGQSLSNYVKQHHPDLKPRRILDMGCGVGHSTLPYADKFPEAELYGVDVGAPMLRYAHARAESLGKAVHYSQQNAEKTDFPDGHFDLIVSHILVHETSHKAIRNIMKEAYRLLAPGGLLVHLETPPYDHMSEFDAFLLDWDTRNNNEPFWGGSHELGAADMAEIGGFGADAAFEHLQPSAFDEAAAQRTQKFQAGDFGGGGAWFLWGAEKRA